MPSGFLDHPRPLAFAHRGGAAHAPENSWRAFQHAVSLGYAYLETDLQATSDGVLLAFHDRTLDRVTGRPGQVARMTHRELSGALIDGTEPIPLLEDLLMTWPDIRFNLDLKDSPAIQPLAEVLRRTGAWDRVCIVSFSAARLRAARRAFDRQVCMAASPIGAAVVRLGGLRDSRGQRGPRDLRGPQRDRPHRDGARRTGPALGQPRRAGSRRAAPAVPAGGRSPASLEAQATLAPARARRGPLAVVAERLARTGVRCAQVPVWAATESFTGRAHALGLQVHVWTVNDTATMTSLLDMGVDGIMTDDAVALRDVLISRGQWHPQTG